VKKWLKMWPVFLLLALTPLHFPAFNIDYVLVPLLQGGGILTGYKLLIFVGILETLELWLWYLGWGGFVDMMKRLFEEDINLAKKVAGEMKADGYFDEAKISFIQNHDKLINTSGRIRSFLKKWGVAGAFILGLIPWPGFRVIPDTICGTAKWRAGFVALALGNFTKTAGFVYFWGRVF